MKPGTCFICLQFLLCLLVTSCNPWQEVTVTGLEGIEIKQVSKDGISGVLQVKINNPNKIGFNIYPSSVLTSLNGMPVGSAQLDHSISVAAHAEKTYALAFHIAFEGTDGKPGLNMMTLLSLAFSPNSEIKFKGDLIAGKLFWKKSSHFEYAKKIPLSLH